MQESSLRLSCSSITHKQLISAAQKVPTYFEQATTSSLEKEAKNELNVH